MLTPLASDISTACVQVEFEIKTAGMTFYNDATATRCG